LNITFTRGTRTSNVVSSTESFQFLRRGRRISPFLKFLSFFIVVAGLYCYGSLFIWALSEKKYVDVVGNTDIIHFLANLFIGAFAMLVTIIILMFWCMVPIRAIMNNGAMNDSVR